MDGVQFAHQSPVVSVSVWWLSIWWLSIKLAKLRLWKLSHGVNGQNDLIGKMEQQQQIASSFPELINMGCRIRSCVDYIPFQMFLLEQLCCLFFFFWTICHVKHSEWMELQTSSLQPNARGSLATTELANKEALNKRRHKDETWPDRDGDSWWDRDRELCFPKPHLHDTTRFVVDFNQSSFEKCLTFCVFVWPGLMSSHRTRSRSNFHSLPRRRSDAIKGLLILLLLLHFTHF